MHKNPIIMEVKVHTFGEVQSKKKHMWCMKSIEKTKQKLTTSILQQQTPR